MTISVEKLSDLNERDFKTCVSAYAQQSPGEAKDLLCELTKLSDARIRSQSILMLQVLFGEAVESLAIGALNDNSWLVRTTALDVLSRIRSTKGVQTIAQMLESDGDELVRSWAAYYLGAFGDRSSIAALTRCVANDLGINHEGTPIREIAARALERIDSRFNTE